MSKISKRVLDLLKAEPFHAFKAKEIQRRLNVPENKYQGLRAVLRHLLKEGEIVKFKKNRYGVPASNEIVGELRVNAQGYGFVIWEGGDDVFISQKNMGQAMHKDKVRIRLFAASSGKSDEGQVISVLERARNTIVGIFRWGRKYGYVIPDDLKIQKDIIISAGDENDAQEGQKVVCQIEDWEHYGLNPSGRIVTVLGFPEEAGVDIQSLVHRHEISTDFPVLVEKQAQSLSAEIPQSEIERRLDLRDEVVFTIDPEDAKDFDDAVSLLPLENECWRLGVHIADVSHFVSEKSALDREAVERGTSVYLVDRVIPMLPERVSNELCSLEEGVDKLTFSVLMTLDKSGKLLSYDIKETVIHSKKRFTYAEAQNVIDGELNSPFTKTLQDMQNLSQLFIKRRGERGSIDFDSLEIEIPLDDQGIPIEIRKRERLAAHRLVEEFMLLANETVARHVGVVLKEKLDSEIPFVYRIHEQPDRDSVDELVKMANAFGIEAISPPKIMPRYFSTLATEFQKHATASVLQSQLLRTMMKAQYSPNNIGHFGLAYRSYTHFTSPIRRYPDLTVHRLLKQYSHKGFMSALPSLKDIEDLCKKCTENEIRAQSAERDSVKLKQVQYLERHLNEEFDGVIVRIVNFGFFVELPELLVDGLVHVNSLDDDYYIIDDKNYRLYGEHSGREYKLGQSIRVRLSRVDRNENLVDFVIAGEINDSKTQK
jgi:ribonuclease R